MKATLKTADLVAALARLKMVVARKSTLPVLGSVLLEAREGGLVVSGTDLDTWLTLDVDGEVEAIGAVVVPCARLQAAAAKIEGETLRLSSGKASRLIGESGAMRFELLGLDPAEFPPAPVAPEGTTLAFEKGVFAEAIGRELASVSEDETRYVLCGICLTASEGKLQMVSTDGRKLTATGLEVESEDLGVIIPTASARLMACLDGGGVTELCTDKLHISASGKGWKMVSKLIEGNYPNWRQIMPPSGNGHRFQVNREKLIEAVAFAATIAEAKGQAVRMEWRAKSLSITANTPDVGETAAEIEAEVTAGKELLTAFNAGFLLTVLGHLSTEMVTGEMLDEFAPLRLIDGVSVSVLMPMRIQS